MAALWLTTVTPGTRCASLCQQRRPSRRSPKKPALLAH